MHFKAHSAGRRAVAFAVALLSPPVLAAPATQPDEPSPEATAANVKLVQSQMDYGKAMADPHIWKDEAARVNAARTLIPQIRRIMAEADDLARLDPRLVNIAPAMRRELLPDLAALGDADAVALLKRRKADPDPQQALSAACDLLRVQWRQAGDDPARITTFVKQAQTLAAANPKDRDVTGTLLSLANRVADKDAKSELTQTALAMDNPLARRQREGNGSNAGLGGKVGRPLTLAGKTPDGRPLSTADFKGKVVLVDFWATWCGPCKAELPHVKAMYDKHHAAGLEVVGVSCDYAAKTLTAFTAKNDLPWPQLFDADAAAEKEWHPLASGLGINGIPTMLLIDKKGVCRSVTARADLEKQIPLLLGEPD